MKLPSIDFPIKSENATIGGVKPCFSAAFR